MKLEISKVNSLVLGYWSSRYPGHEMTLCTELNDEYEHSAKWGKILIYKCEGENVNVLYIGLMPFENSLAARPITDEEINFLLDGTLPPEELENAID